MRAADARRGHGVDRPPRGTNATRTAQRTCERGSLAASLPWRALLRLTLLLVAAACGGDPPSPPGPAPATPTPVATPPGPTPGAAPVAAMRLDAPGLVTSVNSREWIAVYRAGNGVVGEGRIVLPPDAGPDAGPVPVVGCGWTPPLDAACEPDGEPVAVGESDWIYAYGTALTPSGFLVPAPSAAGPAGEMAWLLGLGLFAFSDDVRPGPPARFIGTIDVPRLPVLWREPGAFRELLPTEGFRDGPRPFQVDAAGRIVGAGVDPELPVVWRDGDGAYRLHVLPLLDGGRRGGAHGIDGDVIAGWSDDGGGARHAAVWVERDGAFVPHELPIPDDARRCDHAIAVSGPYVAGNCVYPAGRAGAVLWQRTGDATWRVYADLRPLDGDQGSSVVGLAGTLAAGASIRERRFAPVAWRMPVAQGERAR